MTKSARFAEVPTRRDSNQYLLPSLTVTAIQVEKGGETVSLSPSFVAPVLWILLAVAQLGREPLGGNFEDQVILTVVYGAKASHEKRKILVELTHLIGLD
jgi:hypothetical protein